MQKEMKDAQNLYIEPQVHFAVSMQTHLKKAGQLLPAPSSRGEHGAAGPLLADPCSSSLTAHLHTCIYFYLFRWGL